MGGKISALDNAIKKGVAFYNRTHKVKISGLGAIAPATMIALATPLIIASIPLIKSIIDKKAKPPTPAEEKQLDDALTDFTNNANGTAKEESFLKKYKVPLILTGSAIVVGTGLYIYNKNKKK